MKRGANRFPSAYVSRKPITDMVKVLTVLQVLTTSNKKTSDYMSGILPQSSHDIVEEGSRYRKTKPTLITNTTALPDNT